MPGSTNEALAILNKKLSNISRSVFSEQREDFQSFQINSYSGLSLIHEEVHQDLEVLKTRVLKEIFLVTSRII